MNAESYAASGEWSKTKNDVIDFKCFQMRKIEDSMPGGNGRLGTSTETRPNGA
jgi:hypothetical protein